MVQAFRFCRYDVDGPLLTITIDRPEVMNALHPAAHRELAEVWDRYAGDPELRVAIITGAGERAFCAGTDLKALAETGDHAKPPTGFAGITHRFDLFKPVIASINGVPRQTEGYHVIDGAWLSLDTRRKSVLGETGTVLVYEVADCV